MTIKQDFLESDDESGFARLIRVMIDRQIIEIQAHQRYCHRLSITGEKIFYLTVVARKMRHITASELAEVCSGSVARHNGKNGGGTDMLLRA